MTDFLLAALVIIGVFLFVAFSLSVFILVIKIFVEVFKRSKENRRRF